MGLHPCLKGWVFALPRALPFPEGQGRHRARVWWEFSPRSRTGRSPLRTRGAASAAASRPPRLQPGTAGWFPPLPGLFSSRRTRVVPRCLPCPRGQERGSPGRPADRRVAEPCGPGLAESCRDVTPAGGKEFPFAPSKVNSQALSLFLKGPVGRKGGEGKRDGKEGGRDPQHLPSSLGRGVLIENFGKYYTSPRRCPEHRGSGGCSRTPGVPRCCPRPRRSLAGLERGEQRGGALSPRELTAGCGSPSLSEALCMFPGVCVYLVALPDGVGAKLGVPGEICRGVRPCPRPR